MLGCKARKNFTTVAYSRVSKKPRCAGCSKTLRCKARKNLKSEAYRLIRRAMKVAAQRRRGAFFNSLPATLALLAGPGGSPIDIC